MRHRRRTFLLLLPGALAWGALARAQGRKPIAPKVQLFNIPAQPLTSALLAYSNVVGNQVIYDSRIAASSRSNPVIGLYKPDTALRMLLEGSDLTVRHTASQDIILVSISATRTQTTAGAGANEAEGTMALDTLYIEVSPGVENRPDFSDYSRLIRMKVKEALLTSPETARRIYAIRIELWVDEHGRVLRSRFVQPSGKPQLDDAIQRVIEGVFVNLPPPRGMPQPIRLGLLGI